MNVSIIENYEKLFIGKMKLTQHFWGYERHKVTCRQVSLIASWIFLCGADTSSCSRVLLVLFSSLAFTLNRVHADLLVVLLQGSQVLTGLGKLALLHSLSHVPVDECTLGVHQVELVVQTGPGFSNGRGVGQHAHGTLHLGQVSTWNDGGGLVVDANLETSGAPVHELYGSLRFDGGDGGVDILGDNVTTVQHAASHVLAVTGIALDHLVGRLEASIGDFGYRELFMVRLLSGDDRGVSNQREVDSGIRHQVGLELGEIHIQGTIETQRRRDGGHDLTDESVQVGVSRTFNVQVPAANVVDGLIVNHESTVRVLQGGVRREDGVVGLHDSGGHLRSWIDGKFQLGLLPVVNGETLHQKGGEARSSASTERVEDQETLETGALVSQLPDAVQHEVHNLLANGVMTTSVVVGSILFAGDQLLGVKELAISSGTNFVNNGRLQVDKDGPGDVLASSSLREEGVERIIADSNGLVRGHLTIRLDAVLQAVEFPAGIANLDSGLSDVDRDTLTHGA